MSDHTCMHAHTNTSHTPTSHHTHVCMNMYTNTSATVARAINRIESGSLETVHLHGQDQGLRTHGPNTVSASAEDCIAALGLVQTLRPFPSRCHGKVALGAITSLLSTDRSFGGEKSSSFLFSSFIQAIKATMTSHVSLFRKFLEALSTPAQPSWCCWPTNRREKQGDGVSLEAKSELTLSGLTCLRSLCVVI